jgi:hypothetical protein
MKYLFILFLFLSLTSQAQKWDAWKTIDTLKCDSLKIIPIPENCLVINNWAYGDEEIIAVNKVINSVYVLYIKRQKRINVKTGIIQERNQVNAENKPAFDMVKDKYDIECYKKQKLTITP